MVISNLYYTSKQFKELAKKLNTNTFFIAIAVFFLNIGMKYVFAEFSKTHEVLMTSTIFRRFIIFMIFFSVTKDVIQSMTLTAIFVILVIGLFDDRKHYSFVKTNISNNSTKKSTDTIISYEEYMKSKKIVDTYNYQHSVKSDNVDEYEKKINKIESKIS